LNFRLAKVEKGLIENGSKSRINFKKYIYYYGMENLIFGLRVVHIAAGICAFILAPLAVAVKHGGKWHRIAGKFFVIAMITTSMSALLLAYIHPNVFLFMVGIFSFYMACNGYRVLYRKKIAQTKKVAIIDWIIVGVNTLSCVALIIFGIIKLPNSFGIIAIVLGGLGILLSSSDIKSFIRFPQEKTYWLFVHIRNMIGAWIAAVTAFSATTLNFLPPVVQWLWPSLIGGFAISYFSKMYKRKLEKRKVEEAVELKIN
jgi:uncharacterized membrane protein